MAVIVYSTPTCPWCKKVKEFLKKYNVEFEEKDVADNEANKKEMIKKSEQMSVPVIDVNGEIVLGYNTEKLKELLKL